MTRHEPGFTPATARTDDCDCAHADISTPLLVSSTKLQYGFYEIRAKVAAAPLLSSFWLQGEGGEINILDVSPGPGATDGAPRSVNGYHCFEPLQANGAGGGEEDASSVDEQSNALLSGFNPQTDFHVYGVERSFEGVDFYIDGVLVRELKRSEVATSGCLDMPMSVVFSMETLASLGAPSTFDSYTTDVDYFRFWAPASDGECNNEQATFGAVQSGVRYASYANRIQTIRPATLAACQAACSEMVECRFYTFKPDTESTNINNNGGCLLFPEGQSTKTEIGYQSAVKLADGCPDRETDGDGCVRDQVTFGEVMQGKRFSKYTANIGIVKPTTLENCATLCADKGGCGMYSYKSAEKSCLMFPAGLGTKDDPDFVTVVRNPDNCMNAETYARATSAGTPLIMPTCEATGLDMFPTAQGGARVKNVRKKLARRKGITLSGCMALCAGRPDCAQLSYNGDATLCFLFAAGLSTKSKDHYTTYAKQCTTCMAGAWFAEPLLSVRYEYASRDKRIETELFGMTLGACVQWCATNANCAMVTHDEARQECTPFPAGINTRSVHGYTTVMKAPGACDVSPSNRFDVAGSNYPECLFDTGVTGEFGRFGNALQAWDKVGFKQCLTACTALDACGKIAHKGETGKCLLYTSSEPLDRSDQDFVSYTLKAAAPPASECHPPYAAIQRHDLADVKSFDDRMQKIKQERENRLQQEKRAYAKEATKVFAIVIAGIVLAGGLIFKARANIRNQDLVSKNGYILPPNTPNTEDPLLDALRARIRTSKLRHVAEEDGGMCADSNDSEDAFTDVDADLSMISTDMSFTDGELNTSTDSTLSGITRAAMEAAARLYQKAAAAAAVAPPKWVQLHSAPESKRGAFNGPPPQSKLHLEDPNEQYINLDEVREPGYQEFDPGSSCTFLTAENFNPSALPPVAPTPMKPSHARNHSRTASRANEATPLFSTRSPRSNRSADLRRQSFKISEDASLVATLHPDYGSVGGRRDDGGKTTDGSGGGFFGGHSLQSIFSVSKSVDVDNVDGAFDAARDDGNTATASYPSDFEDESSDCYETETETETETAMQSACASASESESFDSGDYAPRSGYASPSFVPRHEEEDGALSEKASSTPLIVRKAANHKVANGQITTEEYDQILQVTAAFAQEAQDDLDADDEEEANTRQYSPDDGEKAKPSWNLTWFIPIPSFLSGGE